mgnify:CR=1 FL=1
METHLKLLGEVQHDAQWLVHMVENLLSVTRLDAEKVRLTDDGCGIPPETTATSSTNWA